MRKSLPFLKFPNIPLEIIIGLMDPIDQFELSLCSERCVQVVQFFGAFRTAEMDMSVQANKRIVLENEGKEMMEFSVSMEPMDWCRVEDYEPRMLNGVKIGMKKENERWLMFIPLPGSSNELPLPPLHNHITNLVSNPSIRNLSIDFDDFPSSMTPFFLSVPRVYNLEILSLGKPSDETLVTYFKERMQVSESFRVNLRHNRDRQVQFCDGPMKTKELIVMAPLQYLGDFFTTNCKRILIENGDYRAEDYEKLISTWFNSREVHELQCVTIQQKYQPEAYAIRNVKIKEPFQYVTNEYGSHELDVIINRDDGATASVIDSQKHFIFLAFDSSE